MSCNCFLTSSVDLNFIILAFASFENLSIAVIPISFLLKKCQYGFYVRGTLGLVFQKFPGSLHTLYCFTNVFILCFIFGKYYFSASWFLFSATFQCALLWISNIISSWSDSFVKSSTLFWVNLFLMDTKWSVYIFCLSTIISSVVKIPLKTEGF